MREPHCQLLLRPRKLSRKARLPNRIGFSHIPGLEGIVLLNKELSLKNTKLKTFFFQLWVYFSPSSQTILKFDPLIKIEQCPILHLDKPSCSGSVKQRKFP